MTAFGEQARVMWNTRFRTLEAFSFPCLYDDTYRFEVVAFDDDTLIGYQISLFKGDAFLDHTILKRPCDYPAFTSYCHNLFCRATGKNNPYPRNIP